MGLRRECPCCGAVAHSRVRVCSGCGQEHYVSKSQITTTVARFACDLRNYGFSFEEVVEMLGLTLTPTALRRELWARGFRFPRIPISPRIDMGLAARWRSQRLSGMRWKAIAREAGKTTSQVYHAVRKLDSIAP